ncbi:MAG: hypothetical protein ACLTLY_10720 [Agathobacter rectalis]
MALEMYDVIIHRTMYCILMIPEYCISSIRHQARTWSIAISPTAHMKDSRAPMRSPHVLQLVVLEGAGTVLYNDHLYYVGNMSDEDMTVQYLYVMDSNGENRKKAAKLENVQNVTAVLYRDNYVIGAYSNRIELNDEGQIVNDDKPEAGIFVIDLDNYKVYMSDKITSEQANITDIYYEDGVVYYSTVRFGDDVTEADGDRGGS